MILKCGAVAGCLAAAVVTMASTPPAVKSPWRAVMGAMVLADPYVPDPVFPCNGPTFAPGNHVAFHWHRIPRATSYTVTLYNVGGRGSVIMPGITDTTISLPMEFQQHYQWDVYSTRPDSTRASAKPAALQSARSDKCGFAVSVPR